MGETLPSWWHRAPRQTVLAYAGSLAGVTAAVILTAVLAPLRVAPTLLFTTAIVVTAWRGGRGPAILATVLSALALDYFFLPPVGSVLSSVMEVVCVLVFILVAGVICRLQDQYQRAAAELHLANEGLEVRVSERTAELTAANASLKAEIDEREKAETALKESDRRLRVAVDATSAALKEKVVLFRELQHRVKNNLQVINSLLILQESKVDSGPVRDMFKDCQNRVRAIAEVHDRLFRTPNLAEFDLAAYLGGLVRNLLRGYSAAGAVSPVIVVEDTTLGADQLIPCALIVNELVCNTLKYAFPDGRPGEVRVEVRHREGRVHLTVADNGVGLSAAPPGGAGVGRQIVQALVEQLSGTITWANGRGTSATVTFPEPK